MWREARLAAGTGVQDPLRSHGCQADTVSESPQLVPLCGVRKIFTPNLPCPISSVSGTGGVEEIWKLADCSPAPVRTSRGTAGDGDEAATFPPAPAPPQEGTAPLGLPQPCSCKARGEPATGSAAALRPIWDRNRGASTGRVRPACTGQHAPAPAPGPSVQVSRT